MLTCFEELIADGLRSFAWSLQGKFSRDHHSHLGECLVVELSSSTVLIDACSPTYFFQQAGISTTESYKTVVGGTACAFVGTIISWFLISKFGRRTLYLGGLIIDSVLLLLIGILASASEQSGSKWAQAALCILWLLIWSATIGPVCYTIVSETSSLSLRAKSVCFSRNIYNITQIIANVIEPYLINPTEANLKGGTAYFWFGTACIAIVWTYFRLPECRGRTYEELNVMFHEIVPARQFASWKGDAYDNDLTKRRKSVDEREE